MPSFFWFLVYPRGKEKSMLGWAEAYLVEWTCNDPGSSPQSQSSGEKLYEQWSSLQVFLFLSHSPLNFSISVELMSWANLKFLNYYIALTPNRKVGLHERGWECWRSSKLGDVYTETVFIIPLVSVHIFHNNFKVGICNFQGDVGKNDYYACLSRELVSEYLQCLWFIM